MNSDQLPRETIPADRYDHSYYLDHMEGAQGFIASQGEILSENKQFALDLANIRPAEKVLDLGCGRGEVAQHCSKLGALAIGLDYSTAAMQISRSLAGQAQGFAGDFVLAQASALYLPFSDNSLDCVLMLDIIEHLYPQELVQAFRQVHRILKPGGRLVIHTRPNMNYYRFGYPIYRSLMRLLGQRLPADPRLRWYRGETHVNLQSPRSLRKTLTQTGYSIVKTWLYPLHGSRLSRRIIGLFPWRWMLVNDILGLCIK